MAFRKLSSILTCRFSIYAVGGRDGAAGLRETESYDPHTNRWSSCAPMQKRRGGVAVAACNGFLFAIGGHESSATNKCTVRHDDGERYDPRCDQWSLITALNRPREALAIAAVNDKLYIVGGFDGKILDEVEKYDPETDRWSKVGAHRRSSPCTTDPCQLSFAESFAGNETSWCLSHPRS